MKTLGMLLTAAVLTAVTVSPSPARELKDKVKEKVIENRTLTEMRAFSQKLAQRIYPPKAPAEVSKTVWEKPALAFDDLVKEFPFLEAGVSGFVEHNLGS